MCLVLTLAAVAAFGYGEFTRFADLELAGELTRLEKRFEGIERGMSDRVEAQGPHRLRRGTRSGVRRRQLLRRAQGPPQRAQGRPQAQGTQKQRRKLRRSALRWRSLLKILNQTPS